MGRSQTYLWNLSRIRRSFLAALWFPRWSEETARRHRKPRPFVPRLLPVWRIGCVFVCLLKGTSAVGCEWKRSTRFCWTKDGRWQWCTNIPTLLVTVINDSSSTVEHELRRACGMRAVFMFAFVYDCLQLQLIPIMPSLSFFQSNVTSHYFVMTFVNIKRSKWDGVSLMS